MIGKVLCILTIGAKMLVLPLIVVVVLLSYGTLAAWLTLRQTAEDLLGRTR